MCCISFVWAPRRKKRRWLFSFSTPYHLLFLRSILTFLDDVEKAEDDAISEISQVCRIVGDSTRTRFHSGRLRVRDFRDCLLPRCRGLERGPWVWGLITTGSKGFSAPAVAEIHSNSIDLSPSPVTFQAGRCSQTVRRPIPRTCPFSCELVVLTWTNETGWVDQNSNRECRNLTDISISWKQ